MILSYKTNRSRAFMRLPVLLLISSMLNNPAGAQTCPSFSTTNVSSNPNTYYPATTANLASGSTSITLGAAVYGGVGISAWDIVLIIQMQGAQINSNNTTSYGSGGGAAQGYVNNAQLYAGKMEFAVATGPVSIGGGTLTLQTGLTNSYKNANFGASGQYRYQVIRVPLYYNITLTGTITAPAWNGTSGGVVVLAATDDLNMNGQLVTASAKGFRGGGGLNHSNPNVGGANTDYRSLSTNLNCGTKGEGIAGTPRYIFASGNVTLVDYGAALEGYPNGCLDRGAPGNAGGGATDGNPLSNSNNAGGGGGGNGAAGGGGGRSWSSQLFTGGIGGAPFAQVTPSRLVMGGGGGSGSTDGGTGAPGSGLASSGAPGGGIVIIRAGSIIGTGTVTANGASPNLSLQNDGAGGGGAGGSVLIISGKGLSGVTVNANGSDGASNTGAGAAHGPGGGGAGGVVYSNAALNAASSVTGGAPGTTQGTAPPTFGATAGSAGILQVITIAQTPTFPLTCNMLLGTGFSLVSAFPSDKAVTIYWQMDNETAGAKYTIERSFDGAVFSVAGSIAGQYETGANGYSYSDLPAADGHSIVYYRIRCTLPGAYDIVSKTISVTSEATGERLTVTPNPVTKDACLHFFSTRSALLSVRLTGLQGNTVWSRQYTVCKGGNSIYLHDLQALPAGIYVLQVTDGASCQNTRLVIGR